MEVPAETHILKMSELFSFLDRSALMTCSVGRTRNRRNGCGANVILAISATLHENQSRCHVKNFLINWCRIEVTGILVSRVIFFFYGDMWSHKCKTLRHSSSVGRNRMDNLCNRREMITNINYRTIAYVQGSRRWTFIIDITFNH